MLDHALSGRRQDLARRRNRPARAQVQRRLAKRKLKEKLAEEGRSFDAMRQHFRQMFPRRELTCTRRSKTGSKSNCPICSSITTTTCISMNLTVPAQITWRELVVESRQAQEPRGGTEEGQCTAREASRQGEDFAALARTESEGPTSSRNQGGLMQTTPGKLCRQADQRRTRLSADRPGQPGDRRARTAFISQGREPPPRRSGVFRGSSGQDQTHARRTKNSRKREAFISQDQAKCAYRSLPRTRMNPTRSR